ncbi:MAG TPA: ADP-glyceromanno-heptose 6-epimerase [Noviherbaspirillum sp.]|uniref:ADP-glyceromanno-heptose 6-epimerase n=1 Tax=Noviherbaspirillum sp. TaxID=1926288 RepID=UPI002B4945D6|nr:ADP-glyceromanno-heptose 6-epimerase [Noviherbaspirillum sp.]HJV84591.1 ADP-glyceromanno-heptose 6-epimerase [Noviherbaspirillum sp.]
MILVTGAAGFIGSNITHVLSKREANSVFAVDNLSRADKLGNIVDSDIADYLDKEDFLDRLKRGEFAGKFSAVLHQGACSNTMEQDGRYMMRNNYEYSIALFEFCQQENIPFIYASSAAVYGGGRVFKEERQHERPLNIYGYSKFLFDQYVRRFWANKGSKPAAQVVGLRYFNVYGPREVHKGTMASVPYHQYNEFLASGKVKLFGAYNGYEPGTQMRDFIHVDDVVAVNLFFLEHPEKSGIFNLGTGRAQPFNDIAVAVVNSLRPQGGPLSLSQIVEQGLLEYIPFPDKLKGKYQSFTQADISLLREVGYHQPFMDVNTGVTRYMEFLNKAAGR